MSIKYSVCCAAGVVTRPRKVNTQTHTTFSSVGCANFPLSRGGEEGEEEKFRAIDFHTRLPRSLLLTKWRGRLGRVVVVVVGDSLGAVYTGVMPRTMPPNHDSRVIRLSQSHDSDDSSLSASNGPLEPQPPDLSKNWRDRGEGW